MTARPRSLIGTLAACASVLAVQALVAFATPGVSNSSSPCEELRAWAEPYRGSSPTLEELARFDRGHRLAIFNVLTPDVRSQLWREQLRRFDARPELTEQQHEFIREASVLSTPAVYVGEGPDHESLRVFWSRASQAFPSREHKRLFFDLGAVVPGVVVTTAQVPWCECNQGFADGCYVDCVASQCKLSIPGGCGPSGWFACDGMCQ